MELPLSMISLLLLAGLCHVTLGARPVNLLLDPDSETPNVIPWKCNGCDLEQTTFKGQETQVIANRNSFLSGPGIPVPFKQNGHYGFEGMFRILQESKDKLFQVMKATVSCLVKKDGEWIESSYNIAYKSFVRLRDGWILLKGDIEAPVLETMEGYLSVRGPDPEINILMENVTYYELFEDPEWRYKAYDNIDKYRKSNVKLRVVVPNSVDASDYTVQVSLKKHLFPFGTLFRKEIVSWTIYEEVMKKALTMFNWASVQNFKWLFNKGTDDDPDFKNATDMVEILEAHGLKVRGHTLLWDVEKNIPEFVKEDYDEDTLMDRVDDHLAFMMRLANGTLDHWDIVNEHIAGHFFEERTKDPNFSKIIYKKAAAIKARLNDPAKLYMNEFQCVTSGAQTEQYVELANSYKEAGVEGIGIQGHTKAYIKPDPTAMWRRLDRLAETGLEIFMTEFDIAWENERERADWFEDAIRAFYSHKSLSGIIIWGFMKGLARYPYKELMDMENILEPGQRWACLVNKEWSTKETFSLSQDTSFSFRGFKGDYQVVVSKNGVPVQQELFSVGDKAGYWSLKLTTATDAITLPEIVDYVPECISHRAERSLGKQTTSSKDKSLNCRLVNSPKSSDGAAGSVSVSCDQDEVMTGCIASHTTYDRSIPGEKMEYDSETKQAKCTAYNAYSNGGDLRVKATAICCKAAGLTCDYKAAGPSSHFDGAMAEARCSGAQRAIGCSSYSQYPNMDGVKPTGEFSSCVAQSGPYDLVNPSLRSGSEVFAACCKASSKLMCTEVTSDPSERARGSITKAVQCEAGYTMTNCRPFAQDSGAAGVKIYESKDGVARCQATLGENLAKGLQGVIAVATCCQL